MRFIKIEKHDKYDYDDPEWFIGFTFSNDTLTAYQEIYLKDSDLLELAKKLIEFSEQNNKIIFEIGSEDPKDRWAYFFKISIYMYNSSGHTAINITLNNNGENQLSEKSHFSILCTPADVNNLGNQLLNWRSNPTDELYVEFKSDVSRI